MSPAPHAPCRGQHCPVVAMLLAPRSNPLPHTTPMPSAHECPLRCGQNLNGVASGDGGGSRSYSRSQRPKAERAAESQSFL